MQKLSKNDVTEVVDSLVNAIELKPLRLGVIGTSGVGKSSTINALFNAKLKISHTVACTKEFAAVPVSLDLKIATKNKKALLYVIDAPGLGESLNTDPDYIASYCKELPTCDVVLWLMAARNRGLALDQQYLKILYKFCPNIVFGINQVDLVGTQDWETHLNLPSNNQLLLIKDIERDRIEKIKEVIKGNVTITSFSAEKKYNLSILFSMLIDSLPTERKALYDLIRGFKVEDQFPKDALKLIKQNKYPSPQEAMAVKKSTLKWPFSKNKSVGKKNG